MISVELFAGGGGMLLGCEAAGFETALAVEMDKHACATLRRNRPSLDVRHQRVESVDWPAERARLGTVDLVAGGPSCQDFSTAGKGLGENGPRNCWPATLDAVRDLRPRSFLFENVKGMTSRKHLPYLERVVAEFGALGYEVRWRVLDAACYGVPQRRHRVFVVGFLDKGAAGRFWWPERSHSLEALVEAKFVTGSYWREHGLSGDDGLGVGAKPDSDGAGRSFVSADEPSPALRTNIGREDYGLAFRPPAHTPEVAGPRITESRNGTARIEYPLANPTHHRGPSDAFRRQPVSTPDVPGAAQTVNTPAYVVGLPQGAPAAHDPSREEARALKALRSRDPAALLRAKLLRWRTVRDALTGRPCPSWSENPYTSGDLVGLAVQRGSRHASPTEDGAPGSAALVPGRVPPEVVERAGGRQYLYVGDDPDLPSPAVQALAEAKGSDYATRVLVAPTAGDRRASQSVRPMDPDRPADAVQSAGGDRGRHPPSLLTANHDPEPLSETVSRRIDDGSVAHILDKHPPRRLVEPSRAVLSNLAKNDCKGLLEIPNHDPRPLTEGEAGYLFRDARHLSKHAPARPAAPGPTQNANNARGVPYGLLDTGVTVRNVGAGDGLGAGPDSPAPAVPASSTGHVGLAFVDPSSQHAYGDAQGRVHRRPSTTLRRLTPREAARLQNFPDDWVFEGGKTASYRIVGNAAPPALVRAVACAIKAALEAAAVPAPAKQDPAAATGRPSQLSLFA